MDHDGFEAAARRGLPTAKLEQVLSLIDQRLSDGLSLRELAACAGMSQFHFARKFRLSTGQSPHAYLTQRRMERAKRLLHESDLPLAQVARRVGYQTQAHFTGVFRRHVGLTPRVFRLQPSWPHPAAATPDFPGVIARPGPAPAILSPDPLPAE
jgi:AraC family transcriptional regulator